MEINSRFKAELLEILSKFDVEETGKLVTENEEIKKQISIYKSDIESITCTPTTDYINSTFFIIEDIFNSLNIQISQVSMYWKDIEYFIYKVYGKQQSIERAIGRFRIHFEDVFVDNEEDDIVFYLPIAWYYLATCHEEKIPDRIDEFINWLNNLDEKHLPEAELYKLV